MKEDFEMAREELSGIGILRVASDFYMEPRRKGSTYFVKSPKSADKHWSLALFPQNNRYCDFSNAGVSGDCIGFLAYIKNCDQWKALGELRDFYGLTNARKESLAEIRRRILLQQQEERQREERKRAFRAALSGQIGELRQWAGICGFALEKGLYAPFSELWTYCVRERERAERKLDILCAVDCREYPRLKAYSENLPSDRFQWLLDVLSLLAECGAFQATADELKELKEQAAFELRREPGAERRCKVEW